MTNMLIFFARNRIRPGRLDDERRRAPRWSDFIAANEPRLIGFHEFLSEDATHVEYVQIHPDAQSLEHHLRVLAKTHADYRTTLEATTCIRIYGDPTESSLDTLRASVADDTPITVLRDHLGGFTRS